MPRSRMAFPRSACALLLAAWVGVSLPARPATAQPDLMPELPKLSAERWLNSPPLQLADFKGQVVLIEIWTST